MRGAKADRGLVAAVERQVPAARAGDTEAIARVVRLVLPFVLRWCQARVGVRSGRVDADDVAREICVAVIDAVRTHPSEPRPFLTTIVAITSNTANEACRGHRPSVPGAFHALLDRLPELQQAILIMRIVEGLSADETGGLLGMTPDDVRIGQHRALALLRRLSTGGVPAPRAGGGGPHRSRRWLRPVADSPQADAPCPTP